MTKEKLVLPFLTIISVFCSTSLFVGLAFTASAEPIPPNLPGIAQAQELSEAFQAVVWHLFVSHPKLKVNRTKWEGVK